MEEMRMRLEQDRDRVFNDERQKMNELLNLKNYSISSLDASLGEAYHYCKEQYEDSVRRKSVYITRTEIVAKLHIYLISIWRTLRAFHLNTETSLAFNLRDCT